MSHVVRQPSGCWEWTGCLDNVTGRPLCNSVYGSTLAHRASWIVTNGNILNGLCVLHTCDNILCIRPGHLFLGTHKDNTQDMLRKGRGNPVIGEAQGAAKLTVLQVLSIRKLAGLLSYATMSRIFGVSWVSCKNVIFRHTWRHV